jgi:hypothetical protein
MDARSIRQILCEESLKSFSLPRAFQPSPFKCHIQNQRHFCAINLPLRQHAFQGINFGLE